MRMFARVSRFKGETSSVDKGTMVARERILPAARKLDGFSGMLLLGDRSSGQSLAVTFWETEEAMRASEDTANQMRQEGAAETGEQIVAVERYELLLDERR
jgi:heme-degrading monooxygenase HmoA